MSSLKLLHFNCYISHLQVQDKFQIPYFSSLYGIIERKTTRIQSGCRSKQDFTKIPNKMDKSLTLACQQAPSKVGKKSNDNNNVPETID